MIRLFNTVYHLLEELNDLMIRALNISIKNIRSFNAKDQLEDLMRQMVWLPVARTNSF